MAKKTRKRFDTGGYMAHGGETKPSLIPDYKKISNVEVEDIDRDDYPDFSDAYISYAEYDGESMTDEQLEELNQDGLFVYDAIHMRLFADGGMMARGGMIWASPTLRKKYESAFGKDFKPEYAIQEIPKKILLIESYYWNYLLDVLEIEELDEKAANDWKVAKEVEDGKFVQKGPYASRYMYSPSLNKLREQTESEWYEYGSASDFFADGGMMADGEVGEGFSIRDMREKLNRMFPDTFGFTVGNVSKEGNKTLNSAALIVDYNDPYRGLEDKDIQSKLFFPQYKRDHNINFRVMQGGENTYFYFALESEKGNEYIGQFGFKDRGDVPSSYITRFIAFLMEQYGLSFDVKHSIMAYGGMMARGGKVNKRGRLAETLIDFKK